MADTDIDLWPADLAELPVHSPVSLLRKQAEALSRKTGNAILARVETVEYRHRLYSSGAVLWDPDFAHRLVLTVPRLEGYTMVLLTIYQKLNNYPVAAAMSDSDEAAVILNDEDALAAWLRAAFASPRTRQVFSTLMSIAAA